MRKNLWIFAICVVCLIGVLLFCWNAIKHPAVVTKIVNHTEPREQTSLRTHGVAKPVSEPHKTIVKSDSSVSNKIDDSVSKEKAFPTTVNPKPNAVEVENAITFLKNLEKQTTDKETDTENTPKLSQDEMFELILEGVSYYDSLLEDGSVNFVIEISNTDFPGIPSMLGGIWEGSFEFSDHRVRGSVKSPSGTEQFAYDGETFQIFRYKQSVPRLTQQNELVYNTFHDPRSWGWNLSGKRSLTDFINTLDVQNIQTVEWDGSQVYHVTSVQNTMNIELWLNPEKSYRPERFAFSTPSGVGRRIQSVKDYNFQEVAPDLWFPETANSVVSIIDEKSGSATNISTKTVRFTNVLINESIPSSRFSIEPPPGTEVYDARTMEVYTVGGEEN